MLVLLPVSNFYDDGGYDDFEWSEACIKLYDSGCYGHLLMYTIVSVTCIKINNGH